MADGDRQSTGALTVGESPSTVVESLQDATNRHDVDGIVACFAAGYRNETPAHPARSFVGRDQVRRNWVQILTAVPDLTADIIGSLVAGDTPEERMRRILETYSRYAGRPLEVDESVYTSELTTGPVVILPTGAPIVPVNDPTNFLFGSQQPRLTGNPLRPEVTALWGAPYRTPQPGGPFV